MSGRWTELGGPPKIIRKISFFYNVANGLISSRINTSSSSSCYLVIAHLFFFFPVVFFLLLASPFINSWRHFYYLLSEALVFGIIPTTTIVLWDRVDIVCVCVCMMVIGHLLILLWAAHFGSLVGGDLFFVCVKRHFSLAFLRFLFYGKNQNIKKRKKTSDQKKTRFLSHERHAIKASPGRLERCPSERRREGTFFQWK